MRVSFYYFRWENFKNLELQDHKRINEGDKGKNTGGMELTPSIRK